MLEVNRIHQLNTLTIYTHKALRDQFILFIITEQTALLVGSGKKEKSQIYTSLTQ